MSTFALPREKPSRKPAELSLTRLRNPGSLEASRVRWLRSYRVACGVSLRSSTKYASSPMIGLIPAAMHAL